MEGDDFSCERFQPQKWRKDMCRNCYQPLRMHDKKTETTSSLPSPGAGGKADAKVFQRFRVNRDQGIDHSVPARERTQKAQNLEGITIGKVVEVLGAAASVQKSRSPSPSLPKPQPPATVSGVGSLATRPSPTPPPLAVSTETTTSSLPHVTTSTASVPTGTHLPRTTSGSKLPSRPSPPVTAIQKPPPPATINSIRGPSPTTSRTSLSQQPPTILCTTPQPPPKEASPQPNINKDTTERETESCDVESVSKEVPTQDEEQQQERQLQHGEAVGRGPVEDEDDILLAQVTEKAEEGKTRQDMESPDETVSQTGTGTENGNMTKVQEVMEVVEMSAAPVLESTLSFLAGGDVQAVSQEEATPDPQDEEEAVITSPPDTSQVVVTEVAEVQVQEEVENEAVVEDSVQYAGSVVTHQMTSDAVHSTECNTGEEAGAGEMEEREDEEGSEADEEVDGAGLEDTDAGFKSITKRLSLKRKKPKKKPTASEEASEPSPVPQQGEKLNEWYSVD